MFFARRGLNNLWLTIFLLIELAGQAGAQQTASASYQTETNTVYREGGELTPQMKERCRLDLYLPVGKKDFATVVWFHGGGLTGGNRAVPKDYRKRGLG
jgi:carboxylesterase type B